jgi:hypothetical protein
VSLFLVCLSCLYPFSFLHIPLPFPICVLFCCKQIFRLS